MQIARLVEFSIQQKSEHTIYTRNKVKNKTIKTTNSVIQLTNEKSEIMKRLFLWAATSLAHTYTSKVMQKKKNVKKLLILAYKTYL